MSIIEDAPNSLGQNAKEILNSLVGRIERLTEEKSALQSDIKDIYDEAKSSGFDTKVLRQVIRKRKLDAKDREYAETVEDLYMHALGEI